MRAARQKKSKVELRLGGNLDILLVKVLVLRFLLQFREGLFQVVSLGEHITRIRHQIEMIRESTMVVD